MSLPTLTVRIAFASTPYATPTWTDVTAYVEAFSCKRGRSFELDRTQPGTARVRLRNADRRFDPTHSTGPYAPNVLPRKRLNIRATWSATTYDLFTGFVDAWPMRYPTPTDSEVTVTATDGFKMLSRTPLSGTFAQQDSGARITSVLDNAGWPVADRSIASGYSAVQAATLDNTTPLAHLQAVEEAERGQVFIDRAGRLVFADRYQRNLSASTATWGENTAGGELLYADLAPSFDDARIYNVAEVTREGGTKQTATNASSRTAYGDSVFSRTGQLYASDNDASAVANYVVNTYGTPRLRFEQIVHDAQDSPSAKWPLLLAAEIGQKHTVVRRPPGGGSAINLICHIEGLSHTYEVAEGEWRTAWDLSPADTNTYFTLDTHALDGAAVLAW